MVFLFVLSILIIFVSLLIFSKIQIKVLNLNVTSQNKKHINRDYKIILKLYILYKIPIIKIVINDEKIKKIKLNNKLKDKITNIDFTLFKDNKRVLKNVKYFLENINFKIVQLCLKIDFGMENAQITAIATSFIGMLISLFLRDKAIDYKKIKYKVNPLYINENVLNIELSSIFEIKMIHIINIIYILYKKRRSDNNNERTSNRRNYDYSYEQH